MNWLQGLLALLTGNTASKALDIALEKTEDVDKRNALVLEYYRIREESKRAEINRVTVPWVDALHKMGRQLYIAGATAGVFVLLATGHGADLERYADFVWTVLGIGGGYVALKGRGK